LSDTETIPSPAATGDAGGHFEQHVDAFALALLMVGAIPPILTNTLLVEVSLQTRHLGWRTDDLLLVGETGTGVQRKLAAQVKRSFKVTASDEDCRKTFEGFWDDFQATERFNVSEDRLVLITQHGTTVLLRDFNSLLECARAATDSTDFRRRIALEGLISKKAKEQNDAILTILTEHSGSPPNKDDYLRFLRCLSVISYDLNTSTAQTEALVISLLAHVALDSPAPLDVARVTWAKLLETVGYGRPIAKTYRRQDLPAELINRHSRIQSADTIGLRALIEHGSTIRDRIRSTIGGNYELDRAIELNSLFNELLEHQVVIVTGTAGSGKSALAKKLLNQVKTDRHVLAFQAVEFATAHIDETLLKAQTTLNAKQLQAILAGQDRTIVLIESIERLLEHSIRDAFSQFLRIVLYNRTIQLVLTCRDYSVETVRNAFLAPIGLLHFVHEVSALSNEELKLIQEAVPNLSSPLGNDQLRSLFKTPYILDMASRLKWEGYTHLHSAREFREKCWTELIREEQFNSGGMPSRREKAFIDVAYRRATELRPYVHPREPDSEALDALVHASMITRAPDSTGLFAPAHDVLEDWAIIRWLEEQFASTDEPEAVLAYCVGGYPALRRGFRRWLDERFTLDPDSVQGFVVSILEKSELPSYFRDDCLVSALLSDTAGKFLSGCMERIEGGDSQLLIHIIHMLRVACKESPPWLSVPGLPTVMLVPKGCGWEPVIQMVSRQMNHLLPEHSLLVLGLVEDWAKQIGWEISYPPGSEEAGLIIDALLPHFDGYNQYDTRKRALEITLKIPKAMPGFIDLITRAETCDHLDYAAYDLADLLLGSPAGCNACRDFPAEVISLVKSRLRLTDVDFEQEYDLSLFGVNHAFGIREHSTPDFIPASALQGPFSMLLGSHPQEALTFIIDLLNYSGECYGEQRWPGQPLEPARQITIDIPGTGTVQQWMNQRLYCMYRGLSVGPEVLQSALMALEAWLLSLSKMEGVNLELWLLHILRTSNNVMATGVVASVCIAYPDKAGRAGIALLSSRELIQCDRNRMALESKSTIEAFSGLDPIKQIYEYERQQSNNQKHRREDLEALAIRMQLTDLKEEVWRIIDLHRSELPEDQGEETLVWRLSLHRMDVRGYRPMGGPDSASNEYDNGDNSRVYMGPGEIEADVQSMVDSSSESMAVFNRHISLLTRAYKAWTDRSSQESSEWEQLLAEAQAIESDIGEPEDHLRGGPGFVAAICVRDHFSELDVHQLVWCARRVELEIHRNSDSYEEMIRYAKGGMFWPGRACASVVSILAIHKIRDSQALLALALTHPSDEIAFYAHAGVSALLEEEHKALVLRCAASALYRGRITAELRDQEAHLPYFQRAKQIDLARTTAIDAREAIQSGDLDFLKELTSIDFDDWAWDTPTRINLEMLGQHPSWEEAREFFAKVARWLARVWARDRYGKDGRRNFELEHKALRSLAPFALKVPLEDALRLCSPLIDCVDVNTEKAAQFVKLLVDAANKGSEDCFWGLWQEIANKAAEAPWVKRLNSDRPFEAFFIDQIFLSIGWAENVKHWKRIEGHAYRIDSLAMRLPAAPVCLLAYLRFLDTIGQRSLPESFKVVASLLERGDAIRMVSNADTAFYLETLLRRFVYSEPQRLKSERELRDAVLMILDVLVEVGSSSAYRMRDDFVTPLNTSR
jgi:tRNA A37 threonylcarbamoyladenosine biosynthesis protein TsaE